MKVLDEGLLKQFLKLASEKLKGDWVLIGGTVLPLLGHQCTTTDIDFVAVDHLGTEEQLKIMKICQSLDLPIETANGAAQFFLHKIKDFKSHLVFLKEGPHAKIFRPNAFLFIQLKLGRLTETDLSDCLEFLKLKGEELEPVHRNVLSKKIEQAIQRISQADRKRRLTTLLAALKIKT